MSFVVVPEPIRDEIAAWGLSFEVESELYDRLQSGLEYGHEHVCYRLAAPTPTYVYYLSIQDPHFLGNEHSFTFWLTYGDQDDALYVMQCEHQVEECWEPEKDGPSPGEPL